MARSLPSLGVAPIDSYVTNPNGRASGYFETYLDATPVVANWQYTVDVELDISGASLYAAHGGCIKAFMNADATSTLPGDISVIYAYMRLQVATSAGTYLMRLEDNSTDHSYCDGYINMVGDAAYTFAIACGGTANHQATDKTGSGNSALGWMKVNAGGSDRYIQLYGVA